MVKAKLFRFVKQFDGVPKESDLKLEEEELPALQDGQVLAQAEYLSVDPYMRPYTRNVPVGSVMIGTQVAKVIESKSEKVPVGAYLVANCGWRTHTIINEKDAQVMADTGSCPKSLGVGALGMPGVTAYFGFLRLCRPKAGETVVVNAAAGAVGSLVGQIAKIEGCRVIGYAGTEAKCKWIKEDLGFDHVFNYKKVDIAESLKEAAPKGVDCYFDNVGGAFSNAVINHMNDYGRMSICGNITDYNAQKHTEGPLPFWQILSKQLVVEGFLCWRWLSEWPEAIRKMKEYIDQGKIKYRETVTEGFENMPKAFIGLFSGDNVGKAIVKV